ncbi:peptide deformylase [Vagococcus elongatus]|uniref:Peptide deformylase n=1 Tax=Vagococcus elongatus TaxID=180344 RepID=A0A430B485_9ENTE|nr:peptide deformylase [Vagococcus elongatus]RSU15051.1 peptide deformylase [Vagococcus elongatus]
MIKMEDIIREGHPTLRKTAEEVTFPLSDENKQLTADMMEFLKNSQNPKLAEKYDLRGGVGLAAPQLDVSKKIIAVRIPNPKYNPEEEDTAESPTLFSDILINPKIISHSVQLAGLEDGEGCLSVDRVVEGVVVRNLRITISYYTVDGTRQKKKFKGYEAIVIQHEIDHLNGIMFFDRIDEQDPFALQKEITLL